jgi:hypothetical protein
MERILYFLGNGQPGPALQRTAATESGESAAAG